MMELVLTLLVVLAFGCGIGVIVATRLARQRGRRLESLKREQDEIVSEERRLFRFLHALGAAINTDNREGSLHRLIVEGAMKVTGGKGGALYAHDEGRKQLVPRYCSNDCAPLMDVTDKLLAQEQANPGSLLSTLRWQPLPEDSGLVGGVFRTQATEQSTDISKHERLRSVENVHQRNVTMLAAPLNSGGRKLGVLIVTGDAGERLFSQNDLEVFTSLVEQSAFALAHATANREVQTKRQLEAELQTASEVQRILLPSEDPKLDGWVIAGRNRAARILSGDFYEYVRPDNRHFGAVIADVSGKGFPAALVAATARASLQAHAQKNLSPTAVLAAVNRQLAPDIRQDMFISMIYLLVQQGGSEVTLARAGHPNPMLWRRRTKQVEIVQSPGLGVGIDDGDVFERVTKNCSVTMESGDVLLLYTDGINEALDGEGQEFGEERIQQTLSSVAAEGAKAVVDKLVEALNAFVGGKASHDDVTMIALQKA